MLLITGLPDIMCKEGWAVAARCMERWFRLGPYELTEAEKSGHVDMDRLDPQTLATDILTMDWAMGFGRVRTVADELARKWDTRKGRIELLVKLRGWQATRPLCQKPGSWDFGDLTLPVATIDSSFEVNYLSVGAVTDPLDDFYGAVGRATLKAAVSGTVKNGDNGQPVSMQVAAVGIYLRDTYDFLGDQFLGVWSEQGVNRSWGDEFLASRMSIYPTIAVDTAEYDAGIAARRTEAEQPVISEGGAMMPRQPTPAERAESERRQWFSVSNADFARYRAKANRGHSYVNVSDLRVVKMPSPVTITF